MKKIILTPLLITFFFLIAGYFYQNHKTVQTHIHCQGEGSPSVILISGLDSNYSTWDKVFNPLSKITKVCRIEKQFSQLKESFVPLLTQKNLQGDKILVAHSAGGLYTRHYLNHIDNVVALVFLDSAVATPNLYNILKKQSEKNVLTDDEKIYLEFMGQKEKNLGNIPTIIISRGRYPSSQPNNFLSDWYTHWPLAQIELTKYSGRSTHIIAKKSGHNIQIDQPELVIKVIRKIVNSYNKDKIN